MIDIYNYNEPIIFLKDYMTELKDDGEITSVSSFALRLGFNSPQVFVDILRRKKPLKNKYIQHIAEGLCLDKSEILYFQTMVYLHNSKDEEVQQAFKQLLILLNPGSREEVHIQDENLYSNWINIAILTLSNIKGFQISPEYIKSKFLYDVSLEEVTNSVMFLLNNNYLQITENSIRKISKTVTSKTDQKIDSAKEYYAQVIDLAKEAANLDPIEREFQCFSMAIKEENLKMAKQLIRDFRKKLANLCESDDADQVYQTNIQFFPLTMKKAE